MTDSELHYLLWEYFTLERYLPTTEEGVARLEGELAGEPMPELPERLREPPTWLLGD